MLLLSVNFIKGMSKLYFGFKNFFIFLLKFFIIILISIGIIVVNNDNNGIFVRFEVLRVINVKNGLLFKVSKFIVV